MKPVTRSFESLGAWVDWIESTPADVPLSMRASEDSGRGEQSTHHQHSWTFGCDLPQSLKLARAGWQEGTAKMAKFAAPLSRAVGRRILKSEYYYDVTGEEFDIGLLLGGAPEHWLATREVESEATTESFLTIGVDPQATSEVTARTMLARGACVYALVECLELGGVRCKVVMRQTYWSHRRVLACSFDALLKNFGEPMDTAALAFVLAHPAACRRLGFATVERLPGVRCATGDSYGPQGIHNTGDFDLWVGGSFSEADDPGSARAWVVEQLKKQGVHLREE